MACGESPRRRAAGPPLPGKALWQQSCRLCQGHVTANPGRPQTGRIGRLPCPNSPPLRRNLLFPPPIEFRPYSRIRHTSRWQPAAPKHLNFGGPYCHMIRSELIQKISDDNPHLYQRDVEKIVNTIFDEITDAYGARQPGGTARLRGLLGQEARRPHRSQPAHRRNRRCGRESTSPSSRPENSCGTALNGK